MKTRSKDPVTHRVAVMALALTATSAALADPSAPAAPAKAKSPPLTSSSALSAAASAFAGSTIADWTIAPAPTAEPTFRPPVPRTLQLRNGLRVLVVENPALPIVAIALVVPGAGAAFDPADRLGLASFTADLLDEGAGGMTALALAEEEARLGATIEAYADYDVGGVVARTLQKSFEGTLELIAKQVVQPAFEPGEVERVRGDRLTTLEQRRDRPREVANLMLAGALYGARSPYGHAIAGYPADQRAISIDDVRAFHRQRWQPARATLVISGAVARAELSAQLERTLGRWRATGPAARATLSAAAVAPQRPSARLLVADRPAAEQSDVVLGLVGPARKDPRYFAFEVLRTALGDGFTSRLTQRLREDLGITYGVRAGMDWRVARGPLAISTAIVTPETATGIAETLRIVRELASQELSAAELEKAKQNLIRALPAELESNLATASAFAGLVQLGLPPTWLGGYSAGLRRVTARDVKAAAASLLPADRLVVSVVGDLSTLRAALAPLGLGAAVAHDPQGVALPSAPTP